MNIACLWRSPAYGFFPDGLFLQCRSRRICSLGPTAYALLHTFLARSNFRGCPFNPAFRTNSILPYPPPLRCSSVGSDPYLWKALVEPHYQLPFVRSNRLQQLPSDTDSSSRPVRFCLVCCSKRGPISHQRLVIVQLWMRHEKVAYCLTY